jgi:hypothetical protein
MKAEDIRRIEQELGITLPERYRARMVPYPIPAAEGNTDLGVWDNADRLIEFNRELRRGAPGGVMPWPPHFFAIGHAGDGCPYALDLRSGDAVWWVDHSHLDNPSSQKEADSFAAWADKYFATLRDEMAGELVDPDASPQQRAAVEKRNSWWNALAGTVGCLLAAVVIGAVMVGIRFLLR